MTSTEIVLRELQASLMLLLEDYEFDIAMHTGFNLSLRLRNPAIAWHFYITCRMGYVRFAIAKGELRRWDIADPYAFLTIPFQIVALVKALEERCLQDA